MADAFPLAGFEPVFGRVDDYLLAHPTAAQIRSPRSAKRRPAATLADLSSSSRAPTPHELTHADVEEFFDLLINDQLAREDIAGVGIVHDGQITFAKGYGYTNVEKRASLHWFAVSGT